MNGLAAFALAAMTAVAQNDPRAEIDALLRLAHAEESGIVDMRRSVEFSEKSSPYKEALRKRDKFYQQAIKKALIYSGIVSTDMSGKPVMPEGPAGVSILKGRMIAWLPVYKQDEPRSYLRNRTITEYLEGHEGVEPVPKLQDISKYPVRNGGLTAGDGVSTLVGTFKDSDDLIFTLVHEKIHFDQFTDPEVANLSMDEREKRAWLTTMSKIKDHISDDQLEDYKDRAKKRFLEYGNAVRGGRSLGMAVQPVHTAEELEQIKKHARRLEEDMRKDEERLDLLVLMALAEAACADFSSVDSALIRRANPPEPSSYADAQIATYPTAPCRDQLFSGMLRRRLNRKFVSQDWLEASLTSIAENPPAPAAKLGDQTEVPQASVSPAPKVPLHAAFDLARLARMACAGKPLGEAVSDISAWFPEDSLAFKDAPLADLDACERQVYLSLLGAKTLTPELVSGMVPVSSPSGGDAGGSSQDRGADLSHPLRVIPLLKPRF